MEPVRPVGQVFFPLDEELALLPGNLAPSVQEHLTHLASWMPFRRAAQMIERLLKVQISEATARRLTETAGALSEQHQTQAAESLSPSQEQASPQDGAPPQRLALSADGAYVGLVKGQWAEVRTLVIGEVPPLSSPEQEVQTKALSYFSRMTTAAAFARLAEVETRRRGVVQAEHVCAIMDGADWLQGFIDLHRPDALRILDFPHAAQRFSSIAEAHTQHAEPLDAQWATQQCHDLKHLGPQAVFSKRTALPPVEATEEHWRYLQKREALLQYPLYQTLGWPLGSGSVESGNKVVMQARLTGAGMRWATTHVNSMLALRTAICNDRWDEAWQDIVHTQHDQRLLKRQRKAAPHLSALVSSWLLSCLQLRSPTARSSRPTPPRQLAPAATLPGSSRPSANHPWKKGPACRPNFSAKN